MAEKTLCITNDFGPRAGGIETFVMGLIERLPYSSVIVYTSQQGDTTEYDKTWLDKYGVEVIRDRTKILLPTPRVLKSVKKIIERQRIQVVFFGAAAPLAVMAGSLRKVGVTKVVALTHGHEVWWAKVWPFRLAIRYIGSRVDHLTYLGGFTQREISRALTESAVAAMVKIAPGIDTEHFSPQAAAAELRATLGLAEKKVIVSVGRLVHRKGQDSLISAMPQILQSHPEAHILMVGSGPYKDYLEKLAAKLKVQGSITFIGRIQHADLPIYISAGDIFAMPSRSRLAGLEVEGLGIVYLEASSCGLPVVAGKSGGAPDAVIEGETGLTVDGRDSQEIAIAVISLFDDPVRAQAMGLRGREWIYSNWRWEIWANNFSQLLKTNS
jgi:phosphatidylinositol alpha-1,6-mannosyltransferase